MDTDTTQRNIVPPDYERGADTSVPLLLATPSLQPEEEGRFGGHESPPIIEPASTGGAGSAASSPEPGDPPHLVRTASRAVGAAGANESPAAEMTYASRLPPDHPGLRLDKRQGRVLRRGPVLAVAAVIVAVLVAAVALAFSPKSDPAHATTPNLPDEPQTKNVPISDTVQNAPTDKDQLHAPPKLGPPLHGADPNERPMGNHSNATAGGFGQVSLRQAAREERDKAFASPILVDVENPSGESVQSMPVPGVAVGALAPVASGPPKSEPAASLPVGGAGTGDPNMQQHKTDFLHRDGIDNSTYLTQPVVMPRSPYEVKAGTIIPATLLTAINSDLPGQIIGQVRENVYDTVTGNYLIIPQGSKLLANYDSAVSYGQERVLFCWNRLVRPDGVSLSLECMPGADLAGTAGAADDVNHHWWRIITGVALGTLLSASAERAAGNVTGYQPTVAQNWAANAGGAINQAGQQITQKNLAIQPTITVRAGFSVNVIVTKDLTLPPYERPAMSR